jgi:hypothetical protein
MKAKPKGRPSNPPFIMSGKYSEEMWKRINMAETVADLREALYMVCCRLQELEGRAARPWAERDYR